MNIERLAETVRTFLDLEREFQVQTKLQSIVDDLTAIAGAPANGTYQQNLVVHVDELGQVTAALESRLTPAQYSAITEIGGTGYFDRKIHQTTAEIIKSIGMTPAVAQDTLNQFASKRSTFITQLQRLQDALTYLAVKADRLPQGTAELAVLIPDTLFEGDLIHLSRELKVLNDIIRPFSEVATGAPEKVRVEQVSSSDPTFFLGLDIRTVALIGGAISWILKSLKETMDLRGARHQAEKLKVPPQLLEQYDLLMKERLDAAIAAHAHVLAEQSEKDKARQHELHISLVNALTQITARIERGMKIEVILSVTPPAADEGESVIKFEKLKAISQELQYPQIEGAPILAIAAPETQRPEGQP